MSIKIFLISLLLWLTTNSFSQSVIIDTPESDTFITGGQSRLQINSSDMDTWNEQGSSIDIYSHADNSYGTRWYNTNYSEPTTWINGVGAYYSRMWMVISAADQNTGFGYTLVHPTEEPFMLGIMGDIPGPCIAARASISTGSYNFLGMDSPGNTTFKLESDGSLKWGVSTTSNVDTDLFRSDSAMLKTSGALGFGWSVNNPNSLAGLNGGYFTNTYLGEGLSFINDTINVEGKAPIHNPEFTGTIKLPVYTVNTLPSGSQGEIAYVTDALNPTYLSEVIGGGNIVTPVFFDGTKWVAY